MKDLLALVGAVIFIILLGSIISVSSDMYRIKMLTNTTGQEIIKVIEKKINDCELSIPRTKKCTIELTAVIIDNDKKEIKK